MKDTRGHLTPDRVDQYEIRSGAGTGQYLIAGDFAEFEQVPRYTTNKYRLTLKGQPSATQIDDATWEAAKPVPLVRESIFSDYAELAPARGHALYEGRIFAQSGEFWVDSDNGATRLSPNKEWLVLQSRTRIGFGTAYFDVFHVPTGKKLLTIDAPFSHATPDSDLVRTAWLTDKYFLIPVGERHDGYVVCEFGSSPPN